MIEVAKTFFEEQFQVDESQPLIAAVSGGADSMALLTVLRKGGVNFIAVCLDHQLRPESSSEVEFVRDICQLHGIPYQTASLDVPIFAEDQQLGLEEAARMMRYRKLFEIAEIQYASAVVTAHHADDQVETVLMHFLRGTGRPGLSGMKAIEYNHPWASKLPLLRPLLGVRKEEIIRFNQVEGISWLEDSSNSDPTFFRNKLRNEVIPYLEELNPNFGECFLNTSRIIGEEDQYLDEQVEGLKGSVVLVSGDGFVEIDPLEFKKVPLAIQRRLVLKIIKTLRPQGRDFDFHAVEKCCAFLSIPKPGAKLELPDRILGLAEYESVFIYMAEAALPLDKYPQIEKTLENLKASKDGILLNRGWALEISRVGLSGTESNEWEFILPEPLLSQAVIRTRRPGDKINVEGMQGSVPLKKLFINEKIPARYRDAYPILVVDGEVVWVPGLRKAAIQQGDQPDCLLRFKRHA